MWGEQDLSALMLIHAGFENGLDPAILGTLSKPLRQPCTWSIILQLATIEKACSPGLLIQKACPIFPDTVST